MFVNFDSVNTPTMVAWLILNYQGDITECRFGKKHELAHYYTLL